MGAPIPFGLTLEHLKQLYTDTLYATLGNGSEFEISMYRQYTQIGGIWDSRENRFFAPYQEWVQAGAARGETSSLNYVFLDSLLDDAQRSVLYRALALIGGEVSNQLMYDYLMSEETKYWLRVGAQQEYLPAQLWKLSLEQFKSEHCSIVENLEERRMDWSSINEQVTNGNISACR